MGIKKFKMFQQHFTFSNAINLFPDKTGSIFHVNRLVSLNFKP